jgi:hypothetical protein
VTKLVSAFSPSTLRNNFTGHVGLMFGVTASCVVNQLGMWVNSGNTGVQTLTLWQWSGSSSTVSTLLGTTTINLTGATAGAFSYTPLSGGIALTPGNQYIIAFAAVSGGIQWSNQGPVTLTSFAPTGWNGCDDSPGAGKFETGPSGTTYVGLDMDYSLVTPTPARQSFLPCGLI